MDKHYIQVLKAPINVHELPEAIQEIIAKENDWTVCSIYHDYWADPETFDMDTWQIFFKGINLMLIHDIQLGPRTQRLQNDKRIVIWPESLQLVREVA